MRVLAGHGPDACCPGAVKEPAPSTPDEANTTGTRQGARAGAIAYYLSDDGSLGGGDQRCYEETPSAGSSHGSSGRAHLPKAGWRRDDRNSGKKLIILLPDGRKPLLLPIVLGNQDRASPGGATKSLVAWGGHWDAWAECLSTLWKLPCVLHTCAFRMLQHASRTLSRH